ncbi:MAG: VCBS repeat-containing protein [Acidobacteriaceae bacterium]|nr:VCBS repeat-containing protein [Acidobacteriaceae bacterium]MBV9223732.1 VCBS repeat-containing protein [Acidobacteriaceae bacterium]MBV9309097.1 VCBS repeat-containing protein [Acidobacteriaceae bacterium]
MKWRAIALLLMVISLSALLAEMRTRPDEIPFEKHPLDSGSAEAAAVADINNDGKLDIVAGEYWYGAPTWTKHHFRKILYANNYIEDLSTLPLDVDGDGRVDLITSGFGSKKLAWYRNPGATDALWEEHPIQTTYPIEFTFLVDLDNDGKANEILPQFGDPHAPLAWYERDGRGGFRQHVVSPKTYGHGIGVGDVNGDGRNDILTPAGWFEAPPDPRHGSWIYHADWNLAGLLGFLHVADVNGDGRPDVVTSMAHDYGIFWLERTGDGKWEKHLIDDSWSQAHAVVLVDFRRQGNLGLLTGKRYMAHNGHDPGEREPLGVYWYERLLNPTTHSVDWAKHVIDYGGRTGGGIQISVADMDGDGDLDFVVAGKSGLFLFENLTVQGLHSKVARQSGKSSF